MNRKDCFREGKISGQNDACDVQGKTEKKCDVSCGKGPEKGIFTVLLLVAACLTGMQGLFLVIKRVVFLYAEESLFSRSVVTMLSMLAILAVVLLFCRRKQYKLSVFPGRFGIVYIAVTGIAVAFYVVSLFFVNTFTVQNALMLFYGSAVTPVFEELLFRGAIWNRLNNYFDREWKTYLTVTGLFALWHIGYAVGLFLWNGGSLLHIIVMKVLVGAAFGIITGALRYKTKNCYLGILVHGILNVFG